jgi:hypothetical protein
MIVHIFVITRIAARFGIACKCPIGKDNGYCDETEVRDRAFRAPPFNTTCGGIPFFEKPQKEHQEKDNNKKILQCHNINQSVIDTFLDKLIETSL